jgi:hypothetical protein
MPKWVKFGGVGKVIDYCKADDMPSHKGIMRFSSSNTLSKFAQDKGEDKKDFEKLIEYNPEFLYVRVRAVTAAIPNNNGDLFTVEELKRTYETFKKQRVFKNHKSDDVTNAVGDIIDVLWVENPQDKEHPYVECLLRLDRKKDPELVRGVEEGYISDVSMGCRVEYSVCSCCGNKAHKEDEYCTCVKKYKGQKFCPEHRKNLGEHGIYEANFGVEFFELSFVTDGADKEAVVKEVIASGAFGRELHTKMAMTGQILVDTTNPIFQEYGKYLKKIASKEIISNKEQDIVDGILDTIQKFID